jgi:hypothetical protein
MARDSLETAPNSPRPRHSIPSGQLLMISFSSRCLSWGNVAIPTPVVDGESTPQQPQDTSPLVAPLRSDRRSLSKCKSIRTRNLLTSVQDRSFRGHWHTHGSQV